MKIENAFYNSSCQTKLPMNYILENITWCNDGHKIAIGEKFGESRPITFNQQKPIPSDIKSS